MAAEGTLVSHLIELRRRLVRCVIAVVGLFLLMVGFAGDIYATMATPLMNMLPEQGSMIATEIAAPFLTPFKLTFYLSFFLAIPYLLSQAWLFIAPGLYQQEKKLALPVIVISITLFYAGAAFALFVVSPLLYSFFNSVAPAGVIIMPDISRFLDFILKLAFWTGFRDSGHYVCCRKNRPGERADVKRQAALYHHCGLCYRHAVNAAGCDLTTVTGRAGIAVI